MPIAARIKRMINILSDTPKYTAMKTEPKLSIEL